MFSELNNLILEGIKSHGILAVIIGVIIETVVVPLPSPLIIMAAGFILIEKGSLLSIILSALWISVIAGLAQTIGSFLVYGFAYVLGKPFIKNYEKYHGVSWKDIKNFEKKFSKGRKEFLTLMLLRAIPIMPLSVISGVAGILKVDYKKYALATLFGVIPRNFILAILGYSFGEFYHTMAENIDHAESIMTVILASLILFYVAGQKTGFFDYLRKKIL